VLLAYRARSSGTWRHSEGAFRSPSRYARAVGDDPEPDVVFCAECGYSSFRRGRGASGRTSTTRIRRSRSARSAPSGSPARPSPDVDDGACAPHVLAVLVIVDLEYGHGAANQQMNRVALTDVGNGAADDRKLRASGVDGSEAITDDWEPISSLSVWRTVLADCHFELLGADDAAPEGFGCLAAKARGRYTACLHSCSALPQRHGQHPGAVGVYGSTVAGVHEHERVGEATRARNLTNSPPKSLRRRTELLGRNFIPAYAGEHAAPLTRRHRHVILALSQVSNHLTYTG